MSNYALVEDGAVTYVGGVPKSWRNVSGLHLASDAELKEKGWLPFTETVAEVSKYEVKDGTKFIISADGVVGEEQKRDMTDDEKTAKDASDAVAYKMVRREQYGTWEDQLDMMYHSMDGWKSHVKKIKDDNPKP